MAVDDEQSRVQRMEEARKTPGGGAPGRRGPCNDIE